MIQTTPLCIPNGCLSQHFVVLGKTGSGKSSVLRHFVEDLLSKGERVVIIDPKGDWWGLKSSGDGKGEGFPIIAFGDFKEPSATDVPINSHSGKHVAELITGGNRPCVVGFRGWMPGAMIDFWIDFASTLFNTNKGELYLIIDEAHNFAPKGKVQDPKAGKVLHWTNRMLAEGRGLGIVCGIASQRPQKVHNDTLTSCETLVAMRVIHAADRQAIADWIDGCGDKAKGKQVLNELASLERGQAYVWSPEIGYGPTKVSFPKYITFDSFAPPQLQVKINQKGWATVDLADVKEKLTAVIEESKANDPKELKAKIIALEKQLAKPSKASEPEVTNQIIQQSVSDAVSSAVHKERGGFDRILLNLDQSLIAISGGITDQLTKFADLRDKVKEWRGAQVVRSLTEIESRLTNPSKRNPIIDNPRPAAPIVDNKSKNEGNNNLDTTLPSGEKKVLTAIAQHGSGIEHDTIGILTGYKGTSRSEYCRRLLAKGYIQKNGRSFIVTLSGLEALGDYEVLPTGAELQSHYLNTLPEGESKLLRVFIGAYPNYVNNQELIDATGYKGTSISEYRRRLASRRVVTGSAGKFKASDTLFD